MDKLDKTKYRPFNINFTIPQVYSDSLSYYEAVENMNHALHSLVNQLNASWNEMTTKQFASYLKEIFNANVTYTEEDHGLHFNIATTYASGDHVYDPETETMQIITEDEDEQAFKI